MKFRNLSQMAIALVAVFALSNAASAVLVVDESFSQAVGTLNGAPAGTGLQGNWISTTGTLANVIASQTLSYGILPNAGNQVDIPAGQAAGNARATTTSALSDAGLLNNGASLWFSVVTTGASGSNQHSGFAFGNGFLAPSFDGARLDGDALGFYTRQGTVRAAAWAAGGGLLPDFLSAGSLSAPQSSTNFIVGRIDWGATAGDVETITLFTPSLATLALPGTSVSTSIAAFDQTTFNLVSFASRQGVQSFDEIRFGSSFNDVIGATAIPEPGSLVLLGISSLAMLRRRRTA
ncbi:MAG: PEP-CTERM sorting domain-containing protein [Phycisphaeraceae bacterium]